MGRRNAARTSESTEQLDERHAVLIAIRRALRRAFRSGRERFAPTADPAAELLLACGGEHDVVERLLERELHRSPGIDRDEACRRALRRYRRDQ